MKKYSIPRYIWRAVYPMLIFFGLTIFITLVATFGYIIIDAAQTGITDVIVDQPSPHLHLKSPEEFLLNNALLLQLIANAFAFLIFALMWRKIRMKIPKYDNSKFTLLSTVLTIIVCVGMNLLMIALFSITDTARFFTSYEKVAMSLQSGSLTVRIIAICFAAPIVEELVFRGIIFNRLSAWMPSWIAVIVSSVMFGIMHLNLFQGLYTFLIGVAFCVLYVRYRNLLIPIIGHIAFNSVNLLINELLLKTVEEINDFLLLITSLLVTAFCIALIIKHTKAAVPVMEAKLELETDMGPSEEACHTQ